ncbi:hypothetical protein EAH79_00295 [Sphingomonas koreensis]|nr:hypothetical protein EAH79_00295 [Sphingomonas koreensis]
MIYIWINLPAIAVATLLAVGIAAAYRRIAPGPMAPLRPAAIGVATIASFWFAAILAGALILAPPKAAASTMAIGSAVVIWIGFVLPALIATGLLRGARSRVIAADAACWLIVMVVEAAAMALIGLTAPPA